MPGTLGKIRDWVMRNKTPIGGFFLSVWTWAEVTGCPEVYGVDVIALLSISCDLAKKVLGALGFFLVGGGFLSKDDMEKRKQIVTGRLNAPLPEKHTRKDERK